MIKALLFDFSKVLLFPKDESYKGGLNELNNKLRGEPDFHFFDHFELNFELLEFLKGMKNKIPIYMFTKEIIQESPEIKEQVSEVFSGIFSAMKMGILKADPESYKLIAGQLNLAPPEIFYTDDKEENIEAAKSAGCKAIRYENNLQIISELQKI